MTADHPLLKSDETFEIFEEKFDVTKFCCFAKEEVYEELSK